jgi:hypothetical protein
MNTRDSLRGPKIPAAGKSLPDKPHVGGHPAMVAAQAAVAEEPPDPTPWTSRIDPAREFAVSPGASPSKTAGKVKAKRSYDYGPPPPLPVGHPAITEANRARPVSARNDGGQ